MYLSSSQDVAITVDLKYYEVLIKANDSALRSVISMPTKNQEKGKKYEDFSKNILLLKEISWERGIIFDKVSNNHSDKIEGISGAKHQIDIHLLSSNHPDYHLLCECKSHNGPVEKTEACSFVTVIKDIKGKHNDWKIIPCFASNLGFQSGAIKILIYYDIAPLDLHDVSDKEFKITITESSRRPNIKITGVYLKGNVKANIIDGFKNDDRGDILRPEYVLGYYELLDDSGKIIKDLINYKGSFVTGKRKQINNAYDVFKSLITELELDRIEGISFGAIKTEPRSSTNIIKSTTKAVLKINDKLFYHFNKDGTIKKIDYSNVPDED